MKLKELFESGNVTAARMALAKKFIVMSWGRLLYLSHPHLPTGFNNIYNETLHDEIEKYMNADEDEQEEELNEWVSDGMKVDGKILLNRNTIDGLLHACETQLKEDLTLQRFSDDHKIRPHSWVSMTTNPNAVYNGEKKEYFLPKGAWVVLTHGLADKDEIIVSTDVLLEHQKDA